MRLNSPALRSTQALTNAASESASLVARWIAPVLFSIAVLMLQAGCRRPAEVDQGGKPAEGDRGKAKEKIVATTDAMKFLDSLPDEIECAGGKAKVLKVQVPNAKYAILIIPKFHQVHIQIDLQKISPNLRAFAKEVVDESRALETFNDADMVDIVRRLIEDHGIKLVGREGVTVEDHPKIDKLVRDGRAGKIKLTQKFRAIFEEEWPGMGRFIIDGKADMIPTETERALATEDDAIREAASILVVTDAMDKAGGNSALQWWGGKHWQSKGRRVSEDGPPAMPDAIDHWNTQMPTRRASVAFIVPPTLKEGVRRHDAMGKRIDQLMDGLKNGK